MKPLAARKVPLFLILTASLLLTGSVPRAAAQSRLSDKDVEQLMSNLNSDVKSFRPVFDAALKKSAIRGTSLEKDAKQLARQFEKQTEAMRNTFRQKKKADSAFQSVVGTAQQLDAIVRQLGQQSPAAPAWARVQSDLNALYPAFGLTPPAGTYAYRSGV